MVGQFSEWDSADYLKTPQDRANYLSACLEEAGDDSVFMADALVVLARACGMPQIAQGAGLLLSEEGELEFWTFLQVIRALGFKLQVSVVRKV
ncbi:addiction module antidote protein [Pseudomonas sp. MWU13-2105]|uniref:addiction module antidote protein n=1 Tax=Pseudomonas sp. MWU13-2105 TaxID=2935074 RepID=UPI00200E390D|nr:addiction module antidote protein [Pseudomonas sp. MWU13-2105]